MTPEMCCGTANCIGTVINSMSRLTGLLIHELINRGSFNPEQHYPIRSTKLPRLCNAVMPEPNSDIHRKAVLGGVN
ncbi:hypothetical protein TNCV_3341731 [Trichonephila clavipes]|nr:hypothetical protein TNCV_3341731 [Trichonephila clavipes]